MEKFTEKEIKEGLSKAYKEAGHNAYFGEGFRAGIEFANQGQLLPIDSVVGQGEQLVCDICEEPLEKLLGKVCENTMCDRFR